MSLASFELAPGARREFDDAVDWYRERNPDVAARFVAAVNAALLGILEAPERWPSEPSGRRRYVLQHFPFALHYVIGGGHVSIVAIAHGARAPEYWRHRGPP